MAHIKELESKMCANAARFLKEKRKVRKVVILNACYGKNVNQQESNEGLFKNPYKVTRGG